MILKLLKLLGITGCFLFLSGTLRAQNCIPTNINGTVFNLACNQVCSDLNFQIPHIKSTDNYTLVSVPYSPYPYNTPTGSEDPVLYADDQYSSLISLPFTVCFYGQFYTSAVVGSNGLMTFDAANTSCANAYLISQTIPFAGGTICNASSTYYPRASIMGAYSDLDPRTVASPFNRKIQWEVIGSSPCRKFVVSFYRIGVFGSSCGLSTPNTFQMVMHESTGIVEIFIEQKACSSTTNGGRAILGVQNWARDQAVAAPGKNNAVWNENNTGYRFIPSAGTSRYVISELLNMSGTVVAPPADTATTVAGLLDVKFPGFCSPPGSNQFVVRTIFSACDNPANQLISLDTITINRTNSLNATGSATNASCGPPDATITITVPAGVGTPPYTFVLDGGAPVVATSPYTFNNVAAGPHTVVVTDFSGGCTSTVNVTVTLSGTIAATTSSTPTACTGVMNGTITINSAGGTGPYTFSLDGGAPQAGTIPYTFTNVAAGNHTIVVNDLGTGCNSGAQTVIVATGFGVSGNATSTATSCPSATNGTITVNGLTGVAPFTYQLDAGVPQSGANPYIFNNVAAGLHTVIIRDNLGCNILIIVSVATGFGVNGNASSTATSCPTASNGTITVNATAGTAPFTYQLDGGAAQSGTNPYTFINVSAGPHVITINDNVGCSILINVNVAAGTSLTVNTTSTATACTGSNTGTITVTPTNGSGPYNFSLDGGAPVAGAGSYTFINVSAGNHTIIVTDATGCISSPIIVIVAAGPGVSGIATPTATSCPAAANGTIVVNATAGTAPFTYQLDAGAPQSGANPYSFANVSAGNHTVIIADNFGCTLSINVIVNAGPGLTANTVSTGTSCSGASNGSISVTPTNGTAPYTFSLDGGAPVTGVSPFTFTNVAAGNHTILVTDGAGCVTNPITVTVVPGPALTTTVNTTDALCNGGATGIITIAQPTIGTAPYEYSLNGIIWQSSNIFTGLAARTYTAYYRESSGCQGSQPVTVGQPVALTASASIIPVICNGQSNGTITITSVGGISPYQYSIDGGATWQSNNIFNAAAGTYMITIRDANNCTGTQNIAVTEPAALTASSINTTASCNGGNDGIITVTANGGNSTYQYSIDGINFQASNIFNVGPGNYTVTVKDNLGCITSFTTTVTLLGNLTYTQQTDPTICEGKSTQLQLASNATVYAWTPGAGLSDVTIYNPVANPTITTQYIVTATLGRCSVNDTVIVNVNAAPIPDAGPPGFICYGQNYTLQGSGGIQYLWKPSTYLSNASLPNPVAAALKTTTYTLSIVSDINGCSSLVTDDVIVDVTPPIKVTTFPYDTIGYPMDQFQLNATSAASNYTWTPTTGLSNTNIPNPVVTIGNIGDDVIYRVTASTNAGCKGEGFVRVRVYTGPDIYVPTAFTPNGDGRNDKFYPFPVGIKSINYFRVFNRWGQMVFSSTKLNDGWDGRLGGAEQPTGLYVWMAQALTKDNKVITKKGTVTLIR
ncbi:MAG: gliding motility-associated C-terminal domain-containing protein [Bacteroidota bacterium]